MIILKKKLFSRRKEVIKASKKAWEYELGKKLLDSGNESARDLLDRSVRKVGLSVPDAVRRVGRRASRDMVNAGQGVHKTINHTANYASGASLRQTPEGVKKGPFNDLARQFKQSKVNKHPDYDHIYTTASTMKDLKTTMKINQLEKNLNRKPNPRAIFIC